MLSVFRYRWGASLVQVVQEECPPCKRTQLQLGQSFNSLCVVEGQDGVEHSFLRKVEHLGEVAQRFGGALERKAWLCVKNG